MPGLLCSWLPFCIDVRRVAVSLRAASTHSGFDWSGASDCDEVPPWSTTDMPDMEFGSSPVDCVRYKYPANA